MTAEMQVILETPASKVGLHVQDSLLESSGLLIAP